jgi:hypothetical protein
VSRKTIILFVQHAPLTNAFAVGGLLKAEWRKCVSADLLIVIEFDAALWGSNLANGWPKEDSTTTNLVEQPLPQTTLRDVQFRFADRTFQPKEKTIVWIIESILICQYGPKKRTEFQK